MFWKDGEPFRIIGGDLHYFRVHPQVASDVILMEIDCFLIFFLLLNLSLNREFSSEIALWECE